MPPKDETTIDFHYIKTGNYRSFHVDGVFGGSTPQGNLYFELFLERQPTPTKMTFALDPPGKLGPEITREGKTGVIREVECGVVMNMETARVFRDLIDNQIKSYEELRGKTKGDV